MKKNLNSLIDISVSLDTALPTWPGSIGMKVERLYCFENGNDVNVSKLTCDVHTGTHIEAPLHFIPDGYNVTQIPLDLLIGDVFVAYIPLARVITPSELASLDVPRGTERLLLRTMNSKLWKNGSGIFHPDYVALTREAAQWIVDRGIKLLGVDYLSVEIYGDQSSSTHKTLLSGGVIILEGLNLSEINPGIYELICLPLKLVGAEGAPARAVLRDKRNKAGH
jgi:arylformamidase